VYHLGDVVIARRHLETVKRLNGRKILIRGNHDIYKDKDYYGAGFEQIHGVRVFVDQFILSHIPLHPDCVGERFKRNVHGHLHGNRIMVDGEIDPRYLCVCVEQINYTPISFDDVLKMH
jgi:calcineurin-like phosphoesterase family protein